MILKLTNWSCTRFAGLYVESLCYTTRAFQRFSISQLNMSLVLIVLSVLALSAAALICYFFLMCRDRHADYPCPFRKRRYSLLVICSAIGRLNVLVFGSGVAVGRIMQSVMSAVIRSLLFLRQCWKRIN